MKRLLIPSVLFSLILCSAVGVAEEKIPIAAIFALTGRGASSNVRYFHGALLAAEQANEQGGVLGRKVDLIPFDNESTAIGSAEVAKRAIGQGVVAIVGPAWSAHALAAAPVAQQASIPMLSTYATNPKVTEVGNFIFRACYIDTFQAAMMAQFARQKLRLQRVAILYESGNEYSTDLGNFFQKEFVRLGGKITAQVPYLKDSLDYASELEKIKPGAPEAVYLPGYEKETGLIIKQAYKSGLKPLFLGSDSWGDAMPKYLGGPIREGYDLKAWTPESPNPESQRFIRDYRRRFGKKEELSSGAALSYDAMLLLLDAIRRAGSLQADPIRQALVTTADFKGVTGPIRFDKHRNPIKGAVINRYHNSGTPKYYLTVHP